MPESHTTQSVRSTRGRRWLGRLIPLSLVGIAAVLVGFVVWMPATVAPVPPSEIPLINVTVRPVQEIPEFADTFELTAVVEPERVVQVAAEVAGRIERFAERTRPTSFRGRVIPNGVAIDEGEPISAGDPLVYLNKDLAQARFDQAQAQFEYDEREYQRIVDLYEREATSKTELDDAGTKRTISRAALDEAARQLERTTIVAPVSGILNRLPVEVGEYVALGDPVAEIVNIDQVKVVVDAPERDVHYLNVGDNVEVEARAQEDAVFTGQITYISELANNSTRTTRLEIIVDNHNHALRSGQIVRARLTRCVLEDIIMIPLDAVIPLEHGYAVYIEVGGHAERREVELGFIKGRTVQIMRGLQSEDRLIVAGHRYVGPGQTVKVVDNQDAKEDAHAETETRVGADPP